MEGNFMTAENTQKEFDDNKAEAFSEKLLIHEFRPLII
jgi:hypothetical protein